VFVVVHSVISTDSFLVSFLCFEIAVTDQAIIRLSDDGREALYYLFGFLLVAKSSLFLFACGGIGCWMLNCATGLSDHSKATSLTLYRAEVSTGYTWRSRSNLHF